MPWSVKENHSACPAGKPWGVVKDSDGQLEGCHVTEADAKDQQAALYASENRADSTKSLVRANHELEVSGDGRTVYGILLPYDREISVNDGWGPYTEVVRYGACAKTIRERGDRLKLCLNHDKFVRFPVGRSSLLREDRGANGLYGEFRLSQTRDADDALTLVRDGVVDSFSVGMIPVKPPPGPERGRVERTEIRLTECSLVAFPAYEDAVIGGIRSELGIDDDEWERLRGLIRDHPDLVQQITESLDTPDPGAVAPTPDSGAGSEPADEATRDDEPPVSGHSSPFQYTPATHPDTHLTAEQRRDRRRADIDRIRAMVALHRK